MKAIVVTLRLLLLLTPLSLSAAAQAGPFATSDSVSPPGGSRWFGAAQEREAFLPVDQAFRPTAWRQDDTLYIGFESAEGYYLYRSRFALESADADSSLGPLRLPAGQEKEDDYLGRVQVFHDKVVISAPIEHAPPGPLKLSLTFQGCAEAGLCYPPEHVALQAHEQAPPAAFAALVDDAAYATDGDAARQAPDPRGAIAAPPGGDDRFSALLGGASLPLMLGLFFVAGLGLTFTPCVLPMLPIVSSIVIGQRAGRGRAFVLSGSYVLGMALTYAALGTLIGLFGAGLNLQARLQSPWVLVPFALLFVLFALWLFDAFNLRLPNALASRAERASARLQGGGPLGVAAAGALSTLVVSPCVSAPLAGAMTFVSATGNVVLGGGALFALGLGMGVPLIAVSTFGLGLLPRSGAWMNAVKAIFGVMMLGVALWLITRLLPPPLAVLLWGALAVGVGLALGALGLATPGGWPRVRQALGVIALVWGIACIVGAARGAHDPLAPLALNASSFASSSAPQQALSFETVTTPAQLDRALAQAAQRGEPAFVDFYADWCISCREMERSLLPQPEIVSRLQRFALIRADVTRDSAETRALLRRFDLFGPPSLLFFTAQREIAGSRIQGETDVATLIRRLDAALEASRP